MAKGRFQLGQGSGEKLECYIFWHRSGILEGFLLTLGAKSSGGFAA
jgi:hypothetical protein